MAYETKELQGSLFLNGYKETGSKQPDFRGQSKIDGVLYYIAGWKQKTKDGTPFLSLKFQSKAVAELAREARKDAKSDVAPLDDDIPF